MKNVSSEFMAALVSARDRGIVPRRLVYFYAKERDTGNPVELGVWTGDEDMVISVISGTTGSAEERAYYGALNLVVPDIPRVSDMTIQSVTITVSQIASIAQELARGYDLRLAKVEIHDLLLDTVSRLPVAPAEIAFLGEVDAASINTPAAGEEGDISITIVSDAISMLARTNPQKTSYEGQKRRSGDQWGRYKSTVAAWSVPWGQKK